MVAPSGPFHGKQVLSGAYMMPIPDMIQAGIPVTVDVP